MKSLTDFIQRSSEDIYSQRGYNDVDINEHIELLVNKENRYKECMCDSLIATLVYYEHELDERDKLMIAFDIGRLYERNHENEDGIVKKHIDELPQEITF